MSPINTVIELHESPALWPEMKSLEEIKDLQATTLPSVWETTYQGNAYTSLSQKIFDVDAFARYTYIFPPRSIGRWMSIDTGLTDTEAAAKSSIVIGDLMPDYRLQISYCYNEKLQYPDLIAKIVSLAKENNFDKNLKGIIIENKSSGISAIQTISRSAEAWIADLLRPFNPVISKESRWGEASIWCKLGCILLPYPNESVPWMFGLEDDLRNAPDVKYKDNLDSFSQLIIFLENLLGEGYRLRRGVS